MRAAAARAVRRPLQRSPRRNGPKSAQRAKLLSNARRPRESAWTQAGLKFCCETPNGTASVKGISLLGAARSGGSGPPSGARSVGVSAKVAQSDLASSGFAVRDADQVELGTGPNIEKAIPRQITHSESKSPVTIRTRLVSACQGHRLSSLRRFTSHQQHAAGVLRLAYSNLGVCHAGPGGNKRRKNT